MTTYDRRNMKTERIPLLPGPPSSPPSPRLTSALPTTKEEVQGLAAVTVATLALASAAIFVKLSSKIYPMSQILVARYAFQAVMSLAGCHWLGIHPLAQKDGRKWVLIRGIVGSCSSICWYQAIKYLPLADATVIMNMNPIFAAMFAAIMLNEPFGWFERACALISITGVTLVTKPSFLGFIFEAKLPSSNVPDATLNAMQNDSDPAQTIGMLSAFLAAILTGGSFVSIRIAGPRAHFLNHMLSLSVISVVLNSLDMSSFVMPQNTYELGVLSMVLLMSFLSQCLLNRGLQLAPSGSGTLMYMNEIVFAFLFGVIIFDEYPDWLSVLGATTIVGVCTTLGLKKWFSW
ncbi:hypothetical protein BJV82DRAFT_553121 [Fennellomyces sp. T-0311]|nr:hypothetical protein BJV82DRAFT_553121 [Fennellomyces sp. T-0311]